MKVGVISDTHVSSLSQALLNEISKVFDDVEMILHAGDLVGLDVVEELERIAQVIAVYGNMDRSQVRGALPRSETVEIQGQTIGIVHGTGVPNSVWLGGGRVDNDALDRWLLDQFGDVNCIVYGHTHHARMTRRDGVLIFNPGSATGRRPAHRATVGVLAVNDEGIEGKIVEV